MPKQLEKQDVLNGLGSVILYGSGTSSGKFYYRQWVADQKKYIQRIIPDATTMDEAVNGCLEVAFKLKEELGKGIVTPARVRRYSGSSPSTSHSSLRPKESIDTAIEGWITIQQERADAGLIEQSSVKIISNNLRNHVKRYLESKGIFYTDAIAPGTFDDYLIFRNETTALCRSQELKRIKTWLKKYLAKKHLINPSWLFSDDFLPKQVVKETDRLKNPAINEEDWQTIISYVRDEWRMEMKHHVNQRYWYWRNLVWHFLLFSKNTGASPEEIVKMKWRQLEIIDEGRIDSKGVRQPWEVVYFSTMRAKTQQVREIPTLQAKELRRWKAFVIETCEKFNLPMPTKETYVFGNCFPRSGSPDGWRPYHRTSFSEVWLQIRKAVQHKLKGHRHSPHPYCLYSLRATYIENLLMKGVPVVVVARLAGHNIQETQRSYERLDMRKSGFEITSPEFGSKATTKKDVEQLF